MPTDDSTASDIATRDITAASLGLLAAWVVHDAEEWLTMAPTSRETLERLPAWVPVSAELRSRGLSQTHVDLSPAMMGTAMAGAAVLGARSGGRSAIFRGALLGFGVHGLTHLAASVATRRYTTGVLTAPTVVLPYWLWARRVLRRHGIPDQDRAATVAALAMAPLLPAVHAASRRLLGRRSLGPEGAGPARLTA